MLKFVLTLIFLKFIFNSFSFSFLFNPTKQMFIIALIVLGVIFNRANKGLGEPDYSSPPSPSPSPSPPSNSWYNDDFSEITGFFWFLALLVSGFLIIAVTIGFLW